MLKVLEINFHLEYIRTTNTADFRKSKNPSIPVIQSADNINAPPIYPYNEIICGKKIKVHDQIKNYFRIF